MRKHDESLSNVISVDGNVKDQMGDVYELTSREYIGSTIEIWIKLSFLNVDYMR